MSYSTATTPSVKIETLQTGDKFVKSRNNAPMLIIHTFKSVSFGLAYSVDEKQNLCLMSPMTLVFKLPF